MTLTDGTWVVTGAAGKVGRSLVPHLAPVVGELRLLDAAPIPELDDEGAEHLQVDVRDRAALERAFAGADGVVHLAAIADEADFDDLVEVNIVGMRNVLDAARVCGVRRVVFASSNRVTGCWGVDDHLTPAHAVRPDGFYGVSKVACEALGRLYVDKFGLEVVNVRIGSFDERPRDTRHLSTWLSPRDCASAFLAAMQAPNVKYATFYAVSANTRRWWDLDTGRALGFQPVDDAEDYADSIEIEPIPGGLQGGRFATPEFSLERQRAH